MYISLKYRTHSMKQHSSVKVMYFKGLVYICKLVKVFANRRSPNEFGISHRAQYQSSTRRRTRAEKPMLRPPTSPEQIMHQIHPAELPERRVEGTYCGRRNKSRSEGRTPCDYDGKLARWASHHRTKFPPSSTFPCVLHISFRRFLSPLAFNSTMSS